MFEGTTGISEKPDRSVRRAERDGHSLLLKRYMVADAASVYANMLAMWRSSFGAERRPPGLPEPLALEGDTVVMAFVDGAPLAEIGQTTLDDQAFDEFARLVADLHGSGVAVPRTRPASKVVRSLARVEMPEDTQQAYDEVVARAAEMIPSEEPLVLTHGDCSPRNVIRSPDGLVLIDFDRLHLAERGRDIGYFGAWTWARQHLAGEAPSWDTADRFLAAYATWAEVEPASLVQTASFHRSIGMLRILKGWPSVTRSADHTQRFLVEADQVLG